jgi:hypothetical protein
MEKLSMDKIILTSWVARNILIEVLQHRTTVNADYYDRESKECKQTHLEGITSLAYKENDPCLPTHSCNVLMNKLFYPYNC